MHTLYIYDESCTQVKRGCVWLYLLEYRPKCLFLSLCTWLPADLKFSHIICVLHKVLMRSSFCYEFVECYFLLLLLQNLGGSWHALQRLVEVVGNVATYLLSQVVWTMLSFDNPVCYCLLYPTDQMSIPICTDGTHCQLWAINLLSTILTHLFFWVSHCNVGRECFCSWFQMNDYFGFGKAT